MTVGLNVLFATVVLNVLLVVLVCACASCRFDHQLTRCCVILFDADAVKLMQDSGHAFMCARLWTSGTRKLQTVERAVMEMQRILVHGFCIIIFCCKNSSSGRLTLQGPCIIMYCIMVSVLLLFLL